MAGFYHTRRRENDDSLLDRAMIDRASIPKSNPKEKRAEQFRSGSAFICSCLSKNHVGMKGEVLAMLPIRKFQETVSLHSPCVKGLDLAELELIKGLRGSELGSPGELGYSSSDLIICVEMETCGQTFPMTVEA